MHSTILVALSKRQKERYTLDGIDTVFLVNFTKFTMLLIIQFSF